MPTITTRLLGFLSGGLGIALLISIGFAVYQTNELGEERKLTAAQQTSVDTLLERTKADAAKLATRDALIDEQNRAVLALAEGRNADRKAYEARVEAAQAQASTHATRAANILSRTELAEDEVGRCRAAVQLIKETVHVR